MSFIFMMLFIMSDDDVSYVNDDVSYVNDDVSYDVDDSVSYNVDYVSYDVWWWCQLWCLMIMVSVMILMMTAMILGRRNDFVRVMIIFSVTIVMQYLPFKVSNHSHSPSLVQN